MKDSCGRIVKTGTKHNEFTVYPTCGCRRAERVGRHCALVGVQALHRAAAGPAGHLGVPPAPGGETDAPARPRCGGQDLGQVREAHHLWSLAAGGLRYGSLWDALGRKRLYCPVSGAIKYFIYLDGLNRPDSLYWEGLWHL